MKTCYLSICFTLLASFIIAQTTITSSWLPEIGDRTQSIAADMIPLEPGPAGMNQTWDFSGAIPIDTIPILTFEYFDPALSVYSNLFPNSTIGQVPLGMALDSTFVNFYTTTATEVFLDGNAGPGFLIQYMDTKKEMDIPFTMGSSFVDSFAGTTSIEGVVVTAFSGSDTITGDASGTLIIPTGTFGNVLRIMSRNTRIDNVDIGGGLGTVTELHTISYLWLSPDVPATPLATLAISSGESRTLLPPPLPPVITSIPESRSFSYLGDVFASTIDKELTQNSIQVYPNPITDKAIVLWESAGKEDILLIVRDISGRILQKTHTDQQHGINTSELDLSKYVSGLYFIELAGKGQKMVKRMVKH